MNLFKNLFHRHPEAAPVVDTSTASWVGHSGAEYQYEVYDLNAEFLPQPGIYIYARQTEDSSWVPLYIAQTRDLHQRLEGHVTLSDAIANGATHLHAHYCTSGQAARCTEERDLLQRWQPLCNDPVES